MNKLGLYILLCLLALPAWAEHKNIQWQLRSEGALVERAMGYLQRLDKPSGAVQHLLDVDVKITPKQVKTRKKIIWYLADEESIKSFGTEINYFNELNEQLIFYTALSIDAAGNKHSFQPGSAQVVDSDSYTTFSDQKELVMAMPGLTPGSVMVFDYEVVLDRSRIEMNWSDITYVNNLFQRDELNIRYSWPKDEAIVWSSDSNELQCESMAEGIYCQARNLKVFKRDYSVLWRDVLPQLIVAERNTWDKINVRARKEFDKALLDLSGLESLVDGIKKGNDELKQQIAAAHRFAARDIRYVSMSEYGNTITPHAVAEVLEKRYGDCKDKSALLMAMLNKLGLEAYPVLVSTNRENTEKVSTPSMSFFNHMVVCFFLEGETYCIDATDRTTAWTNISSWIQGKVALPLTLSAQPGTLPRSTYRWQLGVKTRLEFDPQGGVNEQLERRFSGEYAAYMRNELLAKSKQNKQKWLTKTYQELVSSSAQPQFVINAEDDLNSALEINSETYYEPFADLSEKLSYTEHDGWLKDELDSMRLRNEYYPQLHQGLKYTATMNIQLGKAWTASRQTAEIDFEHQFGSMRRIIESMNQDSMVVKTIVTIPQQLIAAKDIPLFNEFLSLIKRHSQIGIGGLPK